MEHKEVTGKETGTIMGFLNWTTSLGGLAGKETTRFLRYSATGTSTFIIDFALLWFFTDILNIQYLISGGLAFLVGISINYPLARRWAFSETERKIGSGYFYFVAIGALGLILTVLLLAFFVEILDLYYLVARLCTAVFVGFWNYFMNAAVNFRVVKILSR